MIIRVKGAKYNISSQGLPIPELKYSIDETFIIGTVGNEPEEEIEEFQPIANYVAGKLASHGVKEGVVIVASSATEMAKIMQLGYVDIYIDSAFPTFVVDILSESSPIAVRWKKGVEKYESVIFVNEESDHYNTNNLLGKMIVFESPSSTSGYFLPKSLLIADNKTVTEKKDSNDAVEANEIGYYFVYDEEAIVNDVIEGKAQAGGINIAELEEFTTRGSKFRILKKSPKVYRHVVTLRDNYDLDKKETLVAVLQSIHKSSEGKQLLEEFSKTTKFVKLANPGDAYFNIEHLINSVVSEIVY